MEIFAAVVILALVVLALCFVPLGYEDDSGFHRGEPPGERDERLLMLLAHELREIVDWQDAIAGARAILPIVRLEREAAALPQGMPKGGRDIEAMAMAIFAARCFQPPCMAYPAVSGDWASLPQSVRDRYIYEAQAAILAVRWPSHEATAAVCPAGKDRSQFVDIWQRMIDAIVDGEA